MSAAKTLPTTFKLQHAHKVEFLKRYRYLLREATYLPDPWLREYWKGYIRSRYRSYIPEKRSKELNDQTGRPKLWESSTQKRKPIKSQERVDYLLKSTRQYLRLLCRTTEGFPQELVKVSEYAYGRAGKRKHELLAPYMVDEPPVDDAVLKSMIEEKLKQSKIDTGPRVPDALRVIGSKQKAQIRAGNPLPTIAHVLPQIPKTNAWGRPMPLKRVKNMKKKGLNDLISKILPPLPRPEWERLRDLAYGIETWEGYKQRRSGWEQHRLIREPHIVARGTALRPRRFTTRNMRRHWARVFLKCFVFEKDPKSGRWEIQWGALEPRKVPEADVEAVKDFFEDADNKGLTRSTEMEIGTVNKRRDRKAERANTMQQMNTIGVGTDPEVQSSEKLKGS